MTRLYITRSQGDCGKNIDQKDTMLIKSYGNTRCRSSRPEVFCKKVVLRNFAKFTGKHLGQCLYQKRDSGTEFYD